MFVSKVGIFYCVKPVLSTLLNWAEHRRQWKASRFFVETSVTLEIHKASDPNKTVDRDAMNDAV
jgi:hypothetical protein